MTTKTCPTCGQVYSHGSLRFCRRDGALLSSAADLSETLKLTPEVLEGRAVPALAAYPVPDTTSLKPNSGPIDSLAVLPLQNAHADADSEYLSDGITESLINMIAKVPEMRVVPRSTVFRFKGADIDPQEIGRQLGVRGVLTGKVHQIGDTLTIQADLIDVVNQAQLWGERYRRQMADIFDLQEEIAREICDRLRVRLTLEQEQRLGQRHTQSPAAYEAYLKGRYYWNKRTEDGLKTSTSFFQQSVDIDPCYAAAYAGLADSYALRAIAEYGLLPPREAMPRAKAAAARALEIDPTLAEAQTTLAHVAAFYDWDWPRAEHEFQEAIRIDPGYALSHHWYACYLAAVGRHEEAIAEERTAQEIDPLSLVINKNIGTVLYYAGDLEESVKQYRKALELEPNFTRTHIYLGLAYARQGRYAEAVAAYQEALRLAAGGSVLRSVLAHAQARSGDDEGARSILAQLEREAEQQYVPAFNFALIHAGLSDTEAAFAWLDKAVEERSSWLVSLNVEPMLESLRADARFAELVDRVGL